VNQHIGEGLRHGFILNPLDDCVKPRHQPQRHSALQASHTQPDGTPMGFASRCIRGVDDHKVPGKRSLRSASLGCMLQAHRAWANTMRFPFTRSCRCPSTEPQRGSAMQPRHGCAAALPGKPGTPNAPPRGTPSGSRHEGCLTSPTAPAGPCFRRFRRSWCRPR
jgi:hypothetical protein